MLQTTMNIYLWPGNAHAHTYSFRMGSKLRNKSFETYNGMEGPLARWCQPLSQISLSQPLGPFRTLKPDGRIFSKVFKVLLFIIKVP